MFPLYDENKIKGRIPWVTAFLAIANIFVFFLIFQNIDDYSALFGYHSADLFNGRFFTVFTSMFLHANWWHLLGNILFLWVFGENLESRLGGVRFLLFYLFCGVCSVIVYTIAGIAGNNALIGASGAISGILGGYLILFPGNKIKSIIPIIFFWTLASLPAWIFIVIWFLYQFFSLSLENVAMVAYSAHLGGFVAGLLFIKKFASRKKLF